MTIFGRQRKIGLRTKLIGLLTVVLVLISAVFLAFTYDDQSRRAETDLLEKSRVLVTEMDAMWDFISLNQNVINYTSDGEYDYKGLHCAIAGKSVAALFSEKTDYSIRFTNLNPRNIYNTPDAYEAAAIETFLADKDTDEVWGYQTEGGDQVFRYVRAMDVSNDCTECHGQPAGARFPGHDRPRRAVLVPRDRRPHRAVPFHGPALGGALRKSGVAGGRAHRATLPR